MYPTMLKQKGRSVKRKERPFGTKCRKKRMYFRNVM